MNTHDLPLFLIEMLAGPPRAGEGVHAWLFRVSRQLHAHLPAGEIIALLENRVATCGRVVTRKEIVDAVQASLPCAWTPTGHVAVIKRERELLDQIEKIEKEIKKHDEHMAQLSNQAAADDPRFHNPDHLRRELARPFVEGETFAEEFDVKAAVAALLKLHFGQQRRNALAEKRHAMTAKLAPLQHKLGELQSQLATVQAELAG